VRIAILGCGLIGGSIGLALKQLPEVSSVVAFDRDPSVAQRAVARGAADRSETSPAGAVADADFVFVATPVLSISDVLLKALPGLKKDVIITDAGSTKSRVVDEATDLLGDKGVFIGGHPMAGSEEEGIEGAKAGLFHGAWWILTPSESVPAAPYGRLHALLSRLGCQVLALRPTLHDELMAIVSHLPHLTAASLMNMAADHGKDKASLMSLAAGGFRDVTRVAASNPTIWIDICTENREAIVRALVEFAQRLDDLRVLIQEGDLEPLRAQLLTARDARRGLGGRKTTGELMEVSIPVPDRPGVLSEVTTLIGNLGINIEDLQITHAEEGAQGVLRLLVLGSDEAHKVQRALEARGYETRATSI
jgi:prephenate dehydrogenase